MEGTTIGAAAIQFLQKKSLNGNGSAGGKAGPRKASDWPAGLGLESQVLEALCLVPVRSRVRCRRLAAILLPLNYLCLKAQSLETAKVQRLVCMPRPRSDYISRWARSDLHGFDLFESADANLYTTRELWFRLFLALLRSAPPLAHGQRQDDRAG